MTFKEELYLLHIDRRAVAEKIGLSYDALSRRLGGFTTMSDPERAALRQIIDAEKSRQGTTTTSTTGGDR